MFCLTLATIKMWPARTVSINSILKSNPKSVFAFEIFLPKF